MCLDFGYCVSYGKNWTNTENNDEHKRVINHEFIVFALENLIIPYNQPFDSLFIVNCTHG